MPVGFKVKLKGFFGVFWGGLYRTFRFLTCSNKVACSFSVFIFIVYIFPPIIILLIQKNKSSYMILKLFDILKIEILHAATFVHLILDEFI